MPVQWVSRRRIQIKNGESTISRVDTRAELSLLVEKISNEIDFFGHINVQAFYKVGEEPKIIEVNPRIGGSSELSIRAGLNSINRLVAFI